MRTVSSRHNPLVRAFRDAAEHTGSDGTRLLLDGIHLVRDARDAGLALETVAVTHEWLAGDSSAAEFVRELERHHVDVVTVSEPVMSALSPVRTPSGVVALATRTPVSIDTICSNAHALVVAAVDVQDPGNLGALLRAAEAGGATGAVVCGASAHPFSWKALRGSMGSGLRLPTAIVAAPGDVVTAAHAHGLRRVASVARTGDAPDVIDWRRRTILFVGGEGAGLPDHVAAACEDHVTIPMQAPVESLNVALAAGLLVYEARRQRRRKSS